MRIKKKQVPDNPFCKEMGYLSGIIMGDIKCYKVVVNTMATVREEIAKNLLFYRKKAGLTQKELAVKLGVKNTAVSNWENGNNSIDIETLFSACEIFGVTLNDMYGLYSSQAVCPALSPVEESLLDSFRSWNEQGKEYIMQTIAMAVPMYKKMGSTSNVENAG